MTTPAGPDRDKENGVDSSSTPSPPPTGCLAAVGPRPVPIRKSVNRLGRFMWKQYVVQLLPSEHRRVVDVVRDPATAVQVQARARILLAAHDGLSDQLIAAQARVSVSTVQRTRRRYAARGLSGALGATGRRWDAAPQVPDAQWVAHLIASTRRIDGALGAAVVDHANAVCLPDAGGENESAAAALSNVEMVRNKLATMKALQLEDELEDILVTLTTEYHLIRVLSTAPQCFVYLALDRRAGNLGMARHQLRAIDLGQGD